MSIPDIGVRLRPTFQGSIVCPRDVLVHLCRTREGRKYGPVQMVKRTSFRFRVRRGALRDVRGVSVGRGQGGQDETYSEMVSQDLGRWVEWMGKRVDQEVRLRWRGIGNLYL